MGAHNNTNKYQKKGSEKHVDHENDATSGKKPFDKKKYRLKKYSNKYKVDQWEDRRKKAVLRTFYKDLQKDQNVSASKVLANSTNETADESSSPKKKTSPFFAAKKEFKRKQAEKQAKKVQLSKIKEERTEALSKYKKKKMENYKKLSKKTKKGQPVMKDRLEMLLEKIKESTSVD